MGRPQFDRRHTMNRNATLALAAALAVTTALARPAAAQEQPPDYSLTFTLYETPGDPESDVKAVVTVDFKEMDRSGSDVQWGVLRIRFLLPAGGGEPERVWLDATQRLSPGERFWVSHADPDDPQPGEFAELPAFEGEADAVSGTETNLLFVFDVDAPLNPELYGGVCVDATYSFALATEPEEPIREGGQEPAQPTDSP